MKRKPAKSGRAVDRFWLYYCGCGALAQLGERRLCKPEVTGSIPVRSIA